MASVGKNRTSAKRSTGRNGHFFAKQLYEKIRKGIAKATSQLKASAVVRGTSKLRERQHRILQRSFEHRLERRVEEKPYAQTVASKILRDAVM
jgi:hypothetical protein